MATVTRWLKWNGVYDLAGICNQPLTSLDSASEQIKAIKERLYLLGFDCGALDNNLNDETKKALLIFNGYCDHPEINSFKGPRAVPAPAVVAPPVDAQQKEKERAPLNPIGLIPNDLPPDEAQQPDAGSDKIQSDKDAPKVAQQLADAPEDEPLLVAIEPIANAPVAAQPAASPYYDDRTVACLKELEDDWWNNSATVQAAPIENTSILLSRKGKERKGNSATLNSTKPLAVRVVSTPKSIVPFSEYAAIELMINGFENVKSLMFRVYRNFDPKTDSISIAGDLMIYQEILDLKAIQALTDKGLDDNTGEHQEAKAYIMKQMIGGGMNGSFGNFIGTGYEKLHAPYKVRVWVSTEENFFDDFTRKKADETQLPPRAKIDQGIYYLQKKELEEVRERRRKSLEETGEEKKDFNLSDPDVDNLTGVHDRSNEEEKKKSEGLRQSWEKLSKMNAALSRSKYWTKRDEQGINLIEEPCHEHNLTFVRVNQIQIEQFPIRFSNDPVGTYWELRKRLDKKGENFSYPELHEVFLNVKRHINIIKRRLCCGQWQQVKKSIKDDTIAFMDNEILPKFAELQSKQFPYDDSINFLNCFMFFFSFIVHKAVVRPELDFYAKFGLQEKKAPDASMTYHNYLRSRRNVIDGCHSTTAQSEYGFSTNHPLENSDNPGDFFRAEGQGVYGFPVMKRAILEKVTAKRKKNLGKVILLPSYNPLDAYFFVKIRAVPMFMVGMLDMQYLNADGIRQIPIGFFEHDLFHVDTGRGIQQFPTLYNRLCEVIENSARTRKPLTEEDIYTIWHSNINKLVKWLATFKDSQPTFMEMNKPKSAKQFTLEFLLFFLLHEPADSARFKQLLLKKDGELEDSVAGEQSKLMAEPVVPEPAFLKNRIYSNVIITLIEDKTNKDFFGDYAKPALPHYDWAIRLLEFFSANLTDLP